MRYFVAVCVSLAFALPSAGQEPSAASSRKPADHQVLVELKVLQISMTKLRRLGFSVEKISEAADGKQGRAIKLDAAEALGDPATSGKTLEALQDGNLVKVLAAPRLVVLSGHTGTIDIGGEDKPKAKSVRFDISPTVADNKTVRLRFRGRITEPAPSAGGKTPPGVRTLDFVTIAELPSGESVTIAGPTQIIEEAYNESVPVLSSVPVVGEAFRKVRIEKNEVRTFVIVRAQIVSPETLARRTSDDKR